MSDCLRLASIILSSVVWAVPLGIHAAAAPADAPHNPPATLPQELSLAQNYPNPFNATTTIAYALPARSRVTLEVYNITGQKVRTLVDEIKPAGEYSVTWDGRDAAGTEVASGIYFYRLTAQETTKTKKMLLLK